MRVGAAVIPILLLSLLLVTSVNPGRAAAQWAPVSDRNYSIDLYQGAILNSTRTVGMGGASIASGEGAAGMFVNAAAPAVRPTTDSDRWDWDWNLDWLQPSLGSDFDNNGGTGNTIQASFMLTGALVGQYREWALGFGASTQTYTIDLPGEPPLFQVARLDLARSFRDEEWTVGIGFRTGEMRIGGASIAGTGTELGVVWRPPGSPLRVGLTASTPVKGSEVTLEGCTDPMDCNGYILPERIRVPWELGAGVAWRVAATPWNRRVPGSWRDERSLLVALDVLVTGAVDDGHGIEAFLEHKLQPSGRTPSTSVRVGGDYEWVPGRLRVRAGSYWEPARFADVSGRIHGTFGADVRVWQFCFWGDRYRVRASLTGDAAARYGNVAASVGLWH